MGTIPAFLGKLDDLEKEGGKKVKEDPLNAAIMKRIDNAMMDVGQMEDAITGGLRDSLVPPKKTDDPKIIKEFDIPEIPKKY